MQKGTSCTRVGILPGMEKSPQRGELSVFGTTSSSSTSTTTTTRNSQKLVLFRISVTRLPARVSQKRRETHHTAQASIVLDNSNTNSNSNFQRGHDEAQDSKSKSLARKKSQRVHHPRTRVRVVGTACVTCQPEPKSGTLPPVGF
eukprot:1208960-Rhodomonas_salina.4